MNKNFGWKGRIPMKNSSYQKVKKKTNSVELFFDFSFHLSSIQFRNMFQKKSFWTSFQLLNHSTNDAIYDGQIYLKLSII